VFEKDPFVKNEILLCIISRKSIDDFRKFIIALNDTSQEHIGKRLTETPLGMLLRRSNYLVNLSRVRYE